MTNETIMLAKGFSAPRVTYPAYITEKLDGVAVKIIGRGEYLMPEAVTRQGEPSLAIDHILLHAGRTLKRGWVLVGELYIPKQPFKYISGLSRRDETQEELRLFVYDMYNVSDKNAPYTFRRNNIHRFVAHTDSPFIQEVGALGECVALDEEGLMRCIDMMLPHAQEGLVIRSSDEVYQEGKRSWGMQKLKKQHTADLQVLGVEEAVSKDGEPLGMLGRIIVSYHGKPVGVGPGKMVHEDRKYVWKHPFTLIGHYIEVAYMPDPSYHAMREPRFIRYRPDKTEESYE